MRTVSGILATLLLCVLSLLSASASSIPAGSYDLSGVTVNGSALTGSVSLDANGMVTSASLGFISSNGAVLSFTNISSTGTSGNNPVADFAYISGSNGQVALYYFTALNASGGIDLCESGSGCSQASYLQIYSPNTSGNLSGGSLTADGAAGTGTGAVAVATTPEPSSALLLATGMGTMAVGMAISRRRMGACCRTA